MGLVRRGVLQEPRHCRIMTMDKEDSRILVGRIRMLIVSERNMKSLVSGLSN